MDLDKVFGIIVMIVASALVALGVVATVGAIRSNGNTDYCYVEMMSPHGIAPQYQLFGHRPWLADRPMGVYSTIDEAKTKADVIGCRFGGN